MAKILDGKIVRDEIRARLAKEVAGFVVKPHLAIIQVGNNPESTTYIEQKKKFGEAIGTVVDHVTFPETVTEQELVAKIVGLNTDTSVHGIIVQIPIPKNLNKNTVIDAIHPGKDVDGLTSANIKKSWVNATDGFIPATARGVVTLLDYYRSISVGKRVVIVGRSELVGKPLFLALLNRDATVTLCHSKTANLSEHTKQADILIVAAGKPRLIGADQVKAGQVVVDVGINMIVGTKLEEEIPGKKMIGDVDFDAVSPIVEAISPVPGGVGPLTVASLFENLIEAYKRSAR